MSLVTLWPFNLETKTLCLRKEAKMTFFPLQSVIFFFILFALLLACTGNLFTAATQPYHVDALYASLVWVLTINHYFYIPF